MYKDQIPTKNRKIDHIKIVLAEDVEYKMNTTLFEDIILIHNSLPELSINEINTKTKLFDRVFDYPILIDSMTGGIKIAERINRNLAIGASKFNIPISCGSQRAALEDPSLADTYKVIKEVSSDIYLIGNIGVQQLLDDPISTASKVIKMVNADALAIHLNPLQEVVQLEGDVNFKGCIKAIEKVINEFNIPIIVKETGAGISREVAKVLVDIGVSAINVAGAGGTSWSAVEIIRNKLIMKDEFKSKIAEPFREWGIPTAASLIEVLSVANIPVIASGGIRSGIDIAKAIALGAAFVGIAKPFLKAALESEDSVIDTLEIFIEQLKMAMLLTGADSIASLHKVKYVIVGRLKEWIEWRGISWQVNQ